MSAASEEYEEDSLEDEDEIDDSRLIASEHVAQS